VNDQSIDRVFSLQDEVMKKHLAISAFARNAYTLISDVVKLNVYIIEKMHFRQDKQDAVGAIAVDSIGPVIVGVRVALWGDMPESLTVLRSAIESCARLQYVVQEQKYQTAVYEMRDGFKQLEYKKVVRQLDRLGTKIDRLHGLISDAAAHATANRLKWNTYDHKGDTYFRVGFARDIEKAELPLFYCMDVCLLVADALRQAYEQEGPSFRWQGEFDEMLKRHTLLKNEYSSRFHEKVEGSESMDTPNS
jgi:hypothetical protein